MYVADLTPHPELEGTLAVGWLDDDHDFSKAPVSEASLDALFEACTSKEVRITRGWHRCDLCGREAPCPVEESWKGRSSGFGHSEIEVTGSDQIRFAAPNLIFHYVVRHQYQPPTAFIKAVLRGQFTEDLYFQIRDFQAVEPERSRLLRLGLARRLGLAEALAERIDLRVATGEMSSSFANQSRDLRCLYVAGRAIEVPWDGTEAGGLALLDSFCETHELAFDEHWAKWRGRKAAEALSG